MEIQHCKTQRTLTFRLINAHKCLSKLWRDVSKATFGFNLPKVILIKLFITSMLFGSVTLAATPADIEAAQRQAEILQRQEQERLQNERDEMRRRADRVDGIDTKPLEPKVSVPALGLRCREIKNISIINAPNLSGAVRDEIEETYAGRCLGVSEIESILSAVTADYISRGFVTTRAYLPQQDLSTGVLTILVIEGVIEVIDVQDGEANSVSIQNIFHNGKGEILNLRDLEQGIDQINRLASNNAMLDIQPGEKQGGSRVVVRNLPSSPYHFNVSLDNQGSKSTGKTQLGISAVQDNLTGYNDMLSLTHRQSVWPDFNHKNSLSENLNFSLPYGYYTVYAGASYSEYDSPIDLPSGQSLVSSGNNKNYNLKLDRVMYRDQNSRASLSGMLTVKESKNYLGGAFLNVSSRKLTVLDLDSHFSTDLLGGAIGINIGYAMGLEIFGALEDIDNLPSDAPRAQFSKFKFGMNYSKGFRAYEQSLTFTSQLTAQKANDALFGSEQISIGGLYSVRGFVDNNLSGDTGYYLRNELSLRKNHDIQSTVIPVRYYLGLDIGKVLNRADGIPDGQFIGMALGVAGSWLTLNWDLFNTLGLSLPSEMKKESSQTWFRLSYAF